YGGEIGYETVARSGSLAKPSVRDKSATPFSIGPILTEAASPLMSPLHSSPGIKRRFTAEKGSAVAAWRCAYARALRHGPVGASLGRMAEEGGGNGRKCLG